MIMSFRHSSERRFFFIYLFILNKKYFVLLDQILSETICLSYFCFSFSNIYLNLKFTAKNWSDPCNFYSKVFCFVFCFVLFFCFFVFFCFLLFGCFGYFIWENIFRFSLLIFNHWYFTTILWQFKIIWTNETYWKPVYRLYQFLHYLQPLLVKEKLFDFV